MVLLAPSPQGTGDDTGYLKRVLLTGGAIVSIGVVDDPDDVIDPSSDGDLS